MRDEMLNVEQNETIIACGFATITKASFPGSAWERSVERSLHICKMSILSQE